MRAVNGISFHGEFPPTLPLRQHSGFLAALAHQPQHMAPRLSLHSAGRQSQRRSSNLPESDADDAAGRLMARSKLDLRRVGRTAWRCTGGRTQTYPRQEFGGSNAPSMDQANSYFSFCLPGLDIFPCIIAPGSVGDAEGPWGLELAAGVSRGILVPGNFFDSPAACRSSS